MCIQTYHLRSLNLHLGMIDFLTEGGYKEALKFFFTIIWGEMITRWHIKINIIFFDKCLKPNFDWQAHSQIGNKVYKYA